MPERHRFVLLGQFSIAVAQNSNTQIEICLAFSRVTQIVRKNDEGILTPKLMINNNLVGI